MAQHLTFKLTRRTCLFFLIIVLHFLGNKNILAQKTDTIFHINGNVLTGELKKMAYGVATWKMDGMGTINFEEVKISTIQSKKLFEIKMKNSFIYFGSFDTSNIDRKVYIVVINGRELIDLEDIVEVYPLRRSFWMRTSGNFSLGANYTKASSVATIALSGKINYRKKKTFFELSLKDNNTYQGDSISSSNSEVSLAWQRSLKNSWSSELSVAASQNTELGTKLRLDLNIIGLKDISYNTWNRLYAGAGVNVARETPYDDSPEKADLAGLFQVVWKVYKYTIPKIWVDANINFLPYITQSNRYRTTLNLNPKISVISDDFKIGFDFYYNFDSSPPSGAASTSDYGINLELSYSFH